MPKLTLGVVIDVSLDIFLLKMYYTVFSGNKEVPKVTP